MPPRSPVTPFVALNFTPGERATTTPLLIGSPQEGHVTMIDLSIGSPDTRLKLVPNRERVYQRTWQM